MPIKIPQYQQQVSPTHQGDGYLQASNNPDAWGESVFRAQQKLGESAQVFAKGMNDIYDGIVNSKVLELSNFIDELDKTDLSDPNNGYYSKLGKDAMRNDDDPTSGSIGVLTNIDDKIKQKQKELGLTWGKGQQMAELVKTRKMDTMYKSATAHEIKQSQYYANTQNEIAISEAINKGMRYRNDDVTREIAYNNGRAAIINNARNQHYDNAATQLQLNKYESDFHSAVIQSFLSDNSLQASEYFEKNKDKILPDAQLKLQNAVKNNELKYISKNISNDLFTMYPDDEQKAIAELDKKNLKPDEYDNVYRETHKLYSEKQRLYNQNQNKMIDDFYDKALPYIQQGQPLSYDLIPDELDSKEKIGLMRFINSNGQPKTDDSAWEELYNKQVNDAVEFANLDLNKYRGYLSENEYKQFYKKQQEIKQGKFYTTIKDDDAKIKTALNQVGFKPGFFKHHKGMNESALNEIRYMVREFEAKRGRSITNDELMNITNSLGYKGENGVKIYRSLEQGLAARTGFIRDVMSDFITYQNQHNGELPPDDVKDKIIRNRITNVIQKQNEEMTTGFELPKAQKAYEQNKTGGTFNGRIINSPYGLRKAPKEGATTDHKGIDLKYSMNEDFTSFSDGIVTAKGSHPKLGNYVSIKDKNGVIHKYGHANFISVKMGQEVKKGYVIGKAGATGTATGPHVHYATLKNGEFVNPFSVTSNNEEIAANNKGWAF